MRQSLRVAYRYNIKYVTFTGGISTCLFNIAASCSGRCANGSSSSNSFSDLGTWESSLVKGAGSIGIEIGNGACPSIAFSWSSAITFLLDIDASSLLELSEICFSTSSAILYGDNSDQKAEKTLLIIMYPSSAIFCQQLLRREDEVGCT